MNITLACGKFTRAQIEVPINIAGDLYNSILSIGPDWQDSESSSIFLNWIGEYCSQKIEHVAEIINASYPASLTDPSDPESFILSTISASARWQPGWSEAVFCSRTGFNDMVQQFRTVMDPENLVSGEASFQELWGLDPLLDPQGGLSDIEELAFISDREGMLTLMRFFVAKLRDSFGFKEDSTIFFSVYRLLHALYLCDRLLSVDKYLSDMLMSGSKFGPLYAQLGTEFIQDVRFVVISVVSASENGAGYLLVYNKDPSQFEQPDGDSGKTLI
ncbi:hypothetical protein VZ95_20795, partial [Elstera litoralis]